MSDNEMPDEKGIDNNGIQEQGEIKKRFPFSNRFEEGIRTLAEASDNLPPVLQFFILFILALVIAILALSIFPPHDRLLGSMVLYVFAAVVLGFVYALRNYILAQQPSDVLPYVRQPDREDIVNPNGLESSESDKDKTLSIQVTDQDNEPIAQAIVTVRGSKVYRDKADRLGVRPYVYKKIERIDITARKKIKGEIWTAEIRNMTLPSEDGSVVLRLLPDTIGPHKFNSQPIPTPAWILIGFLSLIVFGLFILRGVSVIQIYIILKGQAQALNQEVHIEPRNPITLGGHNSDRLPTHRIRDDVYLAPYYLDIHEITNAEYELCVQAGQCNEPRERRQADLPEVVWAGYRTGGDNLPVTQVFAFDAFQYCDWVGKRLPDVAELEYAARGDIHRSYPWGEDNPTTSLVNMIIPPNISDSGSLIPSAGRAVPVNDSRYLSGRTPDTGIAHLIGNVAEWTRTPATQVCQNNIYDCGDTWDGRNNIPAVYLYGDSWYGEVSPSTASYVSEWAMDETNYDIGFRCARSK